MAPPRSKTKRRKAVTLKMVAEHVGLSPATVSVVLNRSPVADSIPQETKDRVIEAARELKYRPNYMARSLRRQRSFSIGVLIPEIIDGYATVVLSGVEAHLIHEGYFYLVASHHSRKDLLDEYLGMLKDRLVEGYVLVNTPLDTPPDLPAVSVSGHENLESVTNVVIDHDHAIYHALAHLSELGHERVAFFKGHPGSNDTEDRWRAILDKSAELGLEVREELTIQLSGEGSGESFTPEEGYEEGYAFGKKLIDRGHPFTALFAFNDVSAIGAMRALLDAGLRVPDDVSVVGFDDIQSAAFHNPGLTTVRQPLREMGQIAARVLLERLAGGEPGPEVVTVEPELVVRGSTGPAPRAASSWPARLTAAALASG